MKRMKYVIVLVHAFVGWALCIGLATLPLQTALIIHAIAAPTFFKCVSLFYFRKFHSTTPLLFVGFVIAMDFFVVALLINRSLEMFASALGTWIPFALIFAATYAAGMYATRKPTFKTAAHNHSL